MEVKEKDTEDLMRVPSWVKCIHCGHGPRANDYLFDLVARRQGETSNVLAHQSCLKSRGKIAGLNAGAEFASK